jgi:hypothetical protein
MSDDRGSDIIGVIVALLITSVITAGLRFYTHGIILKRFFAEDYVMMVAMVRHTFPELLVGRNGSRN